eukprot:comp24147_c0_seq1/m.43929 comp24147_c0_seq1/g.43929  ORF comp24147_c0_seq1/g.43929 comp24147_c0_seq1/m.43929 type:complete len:677 (-) comp24147_c0_seq1:235-2265(-)
MDAALGEALRVWVNTFDSVTVKAETLQDLTDGVALYEVMAEISPTTFDTSMLKYGVKDNWRLKASNVKRLTNGITDFYSDELFMDTSHLDIPDANDIAQSNNTEALVKLVMLVLGAVINCDNKEEYIHRMASLDVDVQAALMKAIQEIMQKQPTGSWGQDGDDLGATPSSKSSLAAGSSTGDEEVFQKMKAEISILQGEKDDLLNRNKDLQKEIGYLRETLKTEQTRAEELEEAVAHLKNYEDPRTPAGKALFDLKRENDRLKEDNDSLEHQKHTLQNENGDLHGQIDSLHRQLDELVEAAGQAKQWKDEADVLRAKMAKVDQMEQAIDTYKKKLEEMSDLKAHLRALENQNKELLTAKLELEDKTNRHRGLKTQLDENRATAASLELGYQELQVARDQALASAKEAREQVATLEAERQRHLDTIADMKEHIEELEMQVASSGPSQRGGGLGGLGLLAPTINTAPDAEEVAKLERELARLKKELAEERSRPQPTAAASSSQTNEELVEARRQISELTAKYQTLLAKSTEQQGMQGGSREADLLVQLDQLLMEKNTLTARVKRAEEERDQHKKMLEHELQQGVGVEFETQLLSLRNLVNEKDLELSQLKQAHRERERKWQNEQQLIVAAWYELGLRYEKLRMGERAAQANQSGSWLKRQRESAMDRFGPKVASRQDR